jgi:spermidine synthase
VVQAVDGTPRRGGGLVLLTALLFFFFSGAAGLLYQVVWTRQLALLFGVTHHAVATVLSIFFLGLAVGSLAGGRWADRTDRPLLWYGVCELVIAAWALLFLALLSQGEEAAAAVLRMAAASRETGIALRALLALLLLFVPVFLMGATLPLLSRHVVRAASAAGARIGLLYSVNTLGAMTGCAVTGFYLLQSSGYTRTTLIGAAINAAVGVLALAIGAAGRPQTMTAEVRDDAVAATTPADTQRWLGVAVLAAFTLSGFSFLALEVIWTRLLAIIFLGTTYAYTTMLVVVLLGIALGGVAGAIIARRSRAPHAWLGAVLAAGGLLVVWQVYGFAELPALLREAVGTDWESEVRTKFLLSVRVLLPVTFVLGATFPLALQSIARAGTLGRDVGLVYAFNTCGGVAGSLAGGFLLLPWLGSQASMQAMAVLGIASGALLLTMAGGATRRTAAALVLVVGMAAAGRPAKDHLTLGLNTGYIPEGHEVLAMREGTEGTVAVSRPQGDDSGSNRVLWINRVQATASIERGVRMNRMQGVLPHLFDRDVRDVLFMCFGSGVTCGTLALGGFEHIDAVEISPDVLAVAPLFEADNLGVLHRPGVEFHIDDGRNFLLVSGRQYDFITFEPMPLALAGVSTFYTQEYYELCRDHLTPRGMVSQWVPLHALNPGVVRSLAATFVEVFPHNCAWFINADLFLIGSNAPLKLDPERAAAKLTAPELQAALAHAGFPDIEELYASFVMDDEALRDFARGGEIMSDDRPWAEFIAPKLVYARTVEDSLERLQGHAVSPGALLSEAQRESPLGKRIITRHTARVHDFEGLKQYYGGASIGTSAFDAFAASLRIDPEHFNSKYYLKQIALQQGERFIAWEMWDKAWELLTRAQQILPGDPELEAMIERLAEAEN